VHNEMIRENSKKKVSELMEVERSRRLSEERLAHVHNEMFREQAKKDAIEATDGEKARRVSNSNMAELQSQLNRRKSIDIAIQLAEEERECRMKEDHEKKVSLQQREAMAMQTESVEQSTMSFEHETSKIYCSNDESKSINDVISTTTALPTLPEPAPIPLILPELPVASANPELEKRLLHELQIQFKDSLPPCDPETEAMRNVRMLRFLRGHSSNVKLAAERYSSMLQLRQKYNLDQIRENIVLGNMTAADFPYAEKIKRFLPAVSAYDIMDPNHNVYCFEKVGAYDIHGFMVNVNDEEWMVYILHEMEHRAVTLDKLSVQNRTMIRCNVLRDLSGFSLTRITRSGLQRLQNVLSLASTCYPETIKRTVFFNTPWIFDTLWKAVKMWLNDAQREKIIFLKRGEFEALKQVCPFEKLPILMGGNNPSIVIPNTGLLGKDSYGLLRENGATEADIRPRDSLQVPFRINSNDTLCWEFSVFAYDVDFFIKFRTQGDGGAEEQTVEGWEKMRVVHGQVEVGSWTAPAGGAVVLCWDNSFSWTRGKTICYKASVAKGTEDSNAIDISGHNAL
ncbi:hypothetical protein THRCLA_10386, partial [Thraustotheca clavata]